MSSTPRDFGTLIVVILKARNLPNKRHIGKQDPYCVVTHNDRRLKTRAIKRGGQHPEWDEEVRFTLIEDVEEDPAHDGDAPPPPPPKDKKVLKKVKGGHSMSLMCYADDPREPDLIGETTVDLTEVLTKGETDEWFEITNKDKYCGEVYLELTFWSNEKPPVKKLVKNSAPNKQYGGPGSFMPTDGQGGSPSGPGSIPASLRTSNSLAHLDLYAPAYETRGRLPSTVDGITDEFGGISLNNHGRRESYPPHSQYGHNSYHGSDGTPSSFTTSGSHYSQGYNHNSYHDPNYSDPATSYQYDRPMTPTRRTSYGAPPAPSFPDYQNYYQPQYEGAPLTNSPGALPPTSSGFVPVNSATPTPSSSYSSSMLNNPPASSYPPAPSHIYGSGYAPSVTPTPASSGFVNPNTYVPISAPTPTPSTFSHPPPSSTGLHPHSLQSVSQQYQYSSYAPPHPASAPPQQFSSSNLSAPTPSPPHSAPSHIYTPVPVQAAPVTPPAPPQHYPPPNPVTSSPSYPAQSAYQPSSSVQNPGSRPLPNPGQRQSSLPPTPTGPHTHNTHTLSHSSSFSSTSSMGGVPGSQSFPTNVPPPPPLPSQTTPPSAYQQYHMNGYHNTSNVPPPPPLNSSQQSSIPPPLPQASTISHEQPFAMRPGLPQPPVAYQPRVSSGFQVPPPPPLPSTTPTPYTYSQSSLPHSSFPSSSQLYPGPPPRPPVQLYEGAQWS